MLGGACDIQPDKAGNGRWDRVHCHASSISSHSNWSGKISTIGADLDIEVPRVKNRGLSSGASMPDHELVNHVNAAKIHLEKGRCRMRAPFVIFAGRNAAVEGLFGPFTPIA
jgi:hypothetical protein